MTNELDKDKVGVFAGGLGCLGVVVIGVVCLCMWGCPHYTVYREGMAGEAKAMSC